MALLCSANTIARQCDGAGQRCGRWGKFLACHTQRRHRCAPRAATGPLQQGLQAQMRRDGRHHRQQSSLRAVSAQAPARAPLAEALPQPAPGFSSIPGARALLLHPWTKCLAINSSDAVRLGLIFYEQHCCLSVRATDLAASSYQCPTAQNARPLVSALLLLRGVIKR